MAHVLRLEPRRPRSLILRAQLPHSNVAADKRNDVEFEHVLARAPLVGATIASSEHTNS